MIVQFYLLFPLLRNLFERHGVLPLILLSVLSWVVQVHFTAKLNALGWSLNTLVIGHLPVFCLGFVLAKYKDIRMSLLIFPGACVLFYFGNLSMYLFAVNGFLRHPFIQQVERHPDVLVKVAILIAFLLFVTFVAVLLRLTEKYFLKTFSKPHTQGIVKAV